MLWEQQSDASMSSSCPDFDSREQNGSLLVLKNLRLYTCWRVVSKISDCRLVGESYRRIQNEAQATVQGRTSDHSRGLQKLRADKRIFKKDVCD